MTENRNGKCEMKRRRSFCLALPLAVSLGMLAIVLCWVTIDLQCAQKRQEISYCACLAFPDLSSGGIE